MTLPIKRCIRDNIDEVRPLIEFGSDEIDTNYPISIVKLYDFNFADEKSTYTKQAIPDTGIRYTNTFKCNDSNGDVVNCNKDSAVKLCRGDDCKENIYNISCQTFMKGNTSCNGLHYDSPGQRYWTVDSKCPCNSSNITGKDLGYPSTCYNYFDLDSSCTLSYSPLDNLDYDCGYKK